MCFPGAELGSRTFGWLATLVCMRPVSMFTHTSENKASVSAAWRKLRMPLRQWDILLYIVCDKNTFAVCYFPKVYVSWIIIICILLLFKLWNDEYGWKKIHGLLSNITTGGRDLAACGWNLAVSGWDLTACRWDLVANDWDLAACGWDLTAWWMRSSRMWMRSIRTLDEI